MYNRTHILCLMTVALNLKTSQFYSFKTNRNFDILQFHNKTVLAYRVHDLYLLKTIYRKVMEYLSPELRVEYITW